VAANPRREALTRTVIRGSEGMSSGEPAGEPGEPSSTTTICASRPLHPLNASRQRTARGHESNVVTAAPRVAVPAGVEP
jgi:hypothetical protein